MGGICNVPMRLHKSTLSLPMCYLAGEGVKAETSLFRYARAERLASPQPPRIPPGVFGLMVGALLAAQDCTCFLLSIHPRPKGV